MDGTRPNSCDPWGRDTILVMQLERDTMKLTGHTATRYTANSLFDARYSLFRAKNSLFGAQQGKRVQHTGIAARIGAENRQNGRKIVKIPC